jgi:hypothetical protein
MSFGSLKVCVLIAFISLSLAIRPSGNQLRFGESDLEAEASGYFNQFKKAAKTAGATKEAFESFNQSKLIRAQGTEIEKGICGGLSLAFLGE